MRNSGRRRLPVLAGSTALLLQAVAARAADTPGMQTVVDIGACDLFHSMPANIMLELWTNP
jgi:hypothetical protein